MAGMPVNFAVPGETALASYSFSELLTGLGYQIFYPGGYRDEETTYNYLIDRQFYGTGNQATADNTDVYDYEEYDTSTFNIPRAVQGRVNVIFAVKHVTVHGGQGSVVNTSAELLVVHTDDSTTSLGSATSERWGNQTGGSTNYKNTSVAFDVDLTNIKIGEKLRIKLGISEENYNPSYGTDGVVTLLANPIEVENPEHPTQVLIPFKINL